MLRSPRPPFTPLGVVVSAQSWLLEVLTKKATAMIKHHAIPTTHHELISLLLPDGLGEGLPKIAELLMNAPSTSVPALTNLSRRAMAKPTASTLAASTPPTAASASPRPRSAAVTSGSAPPFSRKAAISSMYLQGISTRRVTTVMGELCDFDEVGALDGADLGADESLLGRKSDISQTGSKCTDDPHCDKSLIRGVESFGCHEVSWLRAP